MRISATVLRDSESSLSSVRLTTLELSYPRFVHAEFMTHRVFSRNASSSRAIPISRQISMVESHPVYPIEWGSNKPGMQAGKALGTPLKTLAQNEWGLALNDAIKHARVLKDLGVHKQIVNRILEPFAYIRVIVTATEWDNFFKLRISDQAQPEIRSVALAISEAMRASDPKILNLYDCHIPYISEKEIQNYDPDFLMKISAARCARVSYLTHDGLAPDIDKDLALATRLEIDRHSSVFEHQAMCTPLNARQFSGNFRGWAQHRQMMGI